MDLSNRLEKSLLWLCPGSKNASVVFRQYNIGKDVYFVCICTLIYKGLFFKGSAVSSTRVGGFVKSVAEMGENIIVHREKYSSRTGIAGGLLGANVEKRACAELVERDAFLSAYKLRRKTKFLYAKDEISVYLINSAHDDYYTCMAVNNNSLIVNRELLFSVKTDRSVSHAVNGAIGELISKSILKNALDSGKVTLSDKLLLHYKACFNHFNIKRFEELVKGEAKEDGQMFQVNKAIKLSKVKSPIRFFTYWRAESKYLEKMKFGLENISIENKLFFHPFW